MTNTLRTKFMIGDVLSLLCAVLVLVAFFAMPWFELDNDAGTVSGSRIVADTSGDLDLATRSTHMFLIIVPLAAAVAGLVALDSLTKRFWGQHGPSLILLGGLMALVYYYGAFFFENRTIKDNAFDFAGSGFYLALVASFGLVIQYALPRSEVMHKVRLLPFKVPEFPRPRAAWRWPFALLRGVFVWIGAIFGWIGQQLGKWLTGAPVLAYLFGLYAAAELEARAGSPLAELLEFRRGRMPGLFGATKLLEPFSNLDFSGILAPFFPAPTDPTNEPLRRSWDALSGMLSTFGDALVRNDASDPGFFQVFGDVVIYDLMIYIIPIIVVALLLRSLSNVVLLRLPLWGGIALQLVILYLAIDRWSAQSDYRELVLIYMGVNIMLAVSLNLVNGYMGEFSVGHAGFMAVGAYVASVLTMWLFVDEAVFGDAVLGTSGAILTVGFLIALIAGGVAAALAGLLVAFPSFRTRGDYLAIVTLAVNFIVTGVINNIEAIGGARGLNGVPLWTDLRWMFIMSVLSVIAIYNLVSSTFGKGIIAIREDEVAAELMGINTKRVKLVAFLVSSFIAGMAGGLFAHVLAYVNPGVFGIMKSTEALVMVYLGGMGSISGSVIAAVIFTILIEAFRPLAVLKWVVIPLILILLMLFRPQGLFGFREINLNLTGFKNDTPAAPAKEAGDDAAAD